MRTYWAFYWPLALTAIGMVLSIQFQNATLARYPDAVTELAILALSLGVFSFFNASQQFIAQLSNVYARSKEGSRRAWRFVVAASLVITAPLFFLATTTTGAALIELIFSIEPAVVDRVREYLLLLCPLIFLNGQRHYFTGLLAQAQLTGWITVFNFIYLGTVITALLSGFALGAPAVLVVVGAETFAVCLLIGLLLFAYRYFYSLPAQSEHSNVQYRELVQFFIPVSTTGVMFALSRPLLFAFVARMPDGLLTIAALRVAFDFSMIFQQAANQFRHFFITFGFTDLQNKIRFMIVICCGLTGCMLLFSLTDLADLIWNKSMGLSTELTDLAIDVTLIMCLMPAIIIYRNYYHGRLMMERKTGGMAYASIIRVIGIFAAAQILFALQWLNHASAACVLILGFVIEAYFARLAVHRVKKAN
ncbi:MAG TPA: hypothetical protein DDZ32_12660 [Gammaproteobacteria bacterium]|nr:hypothetical protein [Gammaproteobacteria bacterium]